MATCPRCLGPLTENHRCPGGVLRRVTTAVSTVLVGALLGVGFCYMLAERPATAVVLAAAALGAVLANAVRQAINGRS